MKETKNRTRLIIVLGLLSALGPLSIDTYLPAFPAIAKDLHVNTEAISYSLSSFFLGISLGQLVFGPLLDRFGRRLPVMGGLLIYIIASFICMDARSLPLLVVARFLQALGGCAGLVAPRAIVRDEFPVTDTPRIFSLIVLILGISPIVAPTIGGYIVSRTSWDNIFAVLLILGVQLAICSWFIIPDHKVNANVSLSPRAITKSYIDVLKNRDFITSALINALSASGFYCYLSGAPSVFMGGYRLSEHIFSVLFSIIAAGLIGSTQLNLLLLKRSRPAPIISAALVAQNLFGLILVAGTTIFDLPLSLLITIIFFIISCQGLTTPNATAGALEPFSSNAGLASALLGTVQMGMGAIASSLVSHWIGNGKMTMAIGMFCCSFMALLIDRWRRMRLQRGQPAVSTI